VLRGGRLFCEQALVQIPGLSEQRNRALKGNLLDVELRKCKRGRCKNQEACDARSIENRIFKNTLHFLFDNFDVETLHKQRTQSKLGIDIYDDPALFHHFLLQERRAGANDNMFALVIAPSGQSIVVGARPKTGGG
jgi:hypothetical protein